MNQDELKSSLKAIADEHWEAKHEAILLSALGPALAKEAGEMDYRTLLEGKSLKAFIKDTGEDNGYRLVEHPTQVAKVALIPWDAEFEFEVGVSENLPKKSDVTRHRKNRALALLEILATLPEEDLSQISIPVSTLVKLLK